MTAKSILLSKTFWVALIQGCIGVIIAVSTVAPNLGWLLVGKSILDILLRVVTTQSVSVP